MVVRLYANLFPSPLRDVIYERPLTRYSNTTSLTIQIDFFFLTEPAFLKHFIIVMSMMIMRSGSEVIMMTLNMMMRVVVMMTIMMAMTILNMFHSNNQCVCPTQVFYCQQVPDILNNGENCFLPISYCFQMLISASTIFDKCI